MSALRSHIPDAGSTQDVDALRAGYAAIETVKESNALMEELTARIKRHFAEQAVTTEIRERGADRAAGLRCPQCNKRAFCESRRMTIGEKLSTFALMRPFRCRYCDHFECRSIFRKAHV